MGRFLGALLATAVALGGCMSTGAGMSDVKDSLSGGFTKNTDTYGTNRRPDVYGEFTKPSMPGGSLYGR